MKNKKRSAFKKQLIYSITLVASLLLVTVSATYSWFLYQQPNMAYDVKVEVMDTFNLTLKSGQEGDDKITSNLSRDFSLMPVYGNGKDFYSAVFDNMEVADKPGEYVYGPTGEYEMISSEVYEKNIFHMDFVLGVDGFVDLYLEHTDHEKTRTFVAFGEGHENRKSPYGDFSRDNINGAVRVAILQKGEIKCIWVPNSDVELVKNGNEYSIVTGEQATIEEKYTFLTSYNANDKTATTKEIQTQSIKNGHCIIDGITYIWGDIADGNCPKITTVYGEQPFSVIMWIDGNDRECDNALVGGKVQLNLCFTANPYGETAEVQVSNM